MRTLLPDLPPAEFEALLERRRRLGLDRRDEVWAGVLHVVPTPSGARMDVQQQLAVLLDTPARAAGLFPRLGGANVGDSDNFRVPDGVLQRERSSAVWHPTVALAVEILSRAIRAGRSWASTPTTTATSCCSSTPSAARSSGSGCSTTGIGPSSGAD